MTRRTKQQIQEDEAKLLEKKKKSLSKLNEHLSEISSMSDEDTEKINRFIGLFLQCETVYKTLYPEMKKIQGEDIDVRQLKFNVQKFEAALRFFGVAFEHDLMNEMFAAKKSFLTCRDNILHGLKTDSINEVLSNYDDMVEKMSSFLENVANA